MVRYILQRPIATCVVAFTLTLLGWFNMRKLPVSLLPTIPVPELTVHASYPNAAAHRIHQHIALPLRNQLLQLHNLDDLEVISQDGQVTIKIFLRYGTDVELAYLEANEKIDRLMKYLPADMQRPLLMKVSSADIPVFQLNIWMKSDSSDFKVLSDFAQKVLKRRLEQLESIAMVDLTGLSSSQLVVKPNMDLLRHTGWTLNDFAKLIEDQSGELGNLTVREGPYEYSIGFDATLRDVAQVEDLYFSVGGEKRRLIRLGDVASVTMEEQAALGIFTFGGKRSVALAILKEQDAQLLELSHEMDAIVANFNKEYPEVGFQLSRDQTELLRLSIKNLIGSLLVGALLSFIMIYFFMSEKRLLLFIGLVIPISISITMLGFYLLGLTINIVSLAGLVLGIGEIVDSSIIIIENIEFQRRQTLNETQQTLSESCIKGVEEVMRPLFTSVLTNSVVFLPLLFLSGIAGALFMDQAISVSLSLGVSLFCSYTLIPVLYFLVFKTRLDLRPKITNTAKIAERLYHGVLNMAFQRPKMTALLWAMLLGGSTWAFMQLKISGLPSITRTELALYIDWNEPVGVQESTLRIDRLCAGIQTRILAHNGYIGQQQFLLNHGMQQSTSEVILMSKVRNQDDYDKLEQEIIQYLQFNHPAAVVSTSPSLNVFEQLFRTTEAPLTIRVSQKKTDEFLPYTRMDSIALSLQKLHIAVKRPSMRERITLVIDENKLQLYQVERQDLILSLVSVLGTKRVGTLHTGDLHVPITLGLNDIKDASLYGLLAQNFVATPNRNLIALNQLVIPHSHLDYASRYMGRKASYIPLTTSIRSDQVMHFQEEISKLFEQITDLNVTFTGSFYRDQTYIKELKWVLFVAVGMLFLILAAQFESLRQPFIVLLTIIFGTGGALIGLYLTGSTLNIMSLIGFIVLVGLLDNDSILKIDSMNKIRTSHSLMEAIKKGGKKRLQSQLMTYLTTVLGLSPILWASGLGADLQKPLAIVIIVGMTFGVLMSWTFIPLTYYWMHHSKKQVKNVE